jgi:hypothetical protein
MVGYSIRQVGDTVERLINTPSQLWNAWMIAVEDRHQEKFGGGTKDP